MGTRTQQRIVIPPPERPTPSQIYEHTEGTRETRARRTEKNRSVGNQTRARMRVYGRTYVRPATLTYVLTYVHCCDVAFCCYYTRARREMRNAVGSRGPRPGPKARSPGPASTRRILRRAAGPQPSAASALATAASPLLPVGHVADAHQEARILSRFFLLVRQLPRAYSKRLVCDMSLPQPPRRLPHLQPQLPLSVRPLGA